MARQCNIHRKMKNRIERIQRKLAKKAFRKKKAEKNKARLEQKNAGLGNYTHGSKKYQV